jgi:nucleotide-binding universal stress UspA family protein
MNDVRTGRDLVVVGLEHTPAGSAALRWAVQEAVTRGDRVMAVHVYDPASRADLALERDHDAERTQERIQAHRQVVDELGDRAALLGIAISQLDGPVAIRLAQAAQRAVLLVVGKPSEDSHSELPVVLSRACTCPVVVVDEDGVAEQAGEILAIIERGVTNG